MVFTALAMVAACSSAPRKPFSHVNPAASSSVETLSVPPQFRQQAMLGERAQTVAVSDDIAAAQPSGSPGDFERRLSRLEKDFYTLYPSLQNLAALEADMQMLVDELATLTDKDKGSPAINTSAITTPQRAMAAPTPLDKPSMMTSPPSQPIATPAPATQQASKPIKSDRPTLAFLSTAEAVRIGTHANKQRLVVDFTPGSIIDYDIAKQGQNITILLHDSDWAGRTSWQANKKNSLIYSYEADTNSDGSVLTLTTCSGCRVKKAFDMPPESAHIGPKMVIDISR